MKYLIILITLFALPLLAQSYTSSYTGAQIDEVIGGTLPRDVIITEATPTLTIYDSDLETGASVDTSAFHYEIDGGAPSISMYAADGDLGHLSYTTDDRLLLSGSAMQITNNGFSLMQLWNTDLTAGWVQFNEVSARRGYVGYGDAGAVFFGSHADAMFMQGTDAIDFGVGTVPMLSLNSGGFEGNMNSNDIDFRWESDGEDSAIVRDGGSRVEHHEGDLIIDGFINYAVDTSATTDDYKIVIASLGADGFINGQQLWVDVKNGSGTPADNTGACQLYVNGNAAVDIKTQNGGDPAAAWIDVNSVFGVIYDGTNFVLLTPDANP